MVFLVRDSNGYIKSNAEYYKDHHGGYDYEVRIMEGELVLKFCTVMNMAGCNTLFKERKCDLAT